MTFDQAMSFARRGSKVRHSGMGERWSVFYIARGAAKGYYALNPHTGSNYAFRPKSEDKAATDWGDHAVNKWRFDQAIGEVDEILGFVCKTMCDFFVGLSTANLVIVPATAILTGELYGQTAFLCGAIIVSAISFCEFYCRRDENGAA